MTEVADQMPASVLVKEYRNQAQFQYDARKLERQGYAVASVADRPQRVGLIRILMTGFLALLWKPPHGLLVTYRLESSPISPSPATMQRANISAEGTQTNVGGPRAESLGAMTWRGFLSYLEWVGTLSTSGQVFAVGVPVIIVMAIVSTIVKAF